MTTTTPTKADHLSVSDSLLAILEKQRQAHFKDGSVSLDKRRDRLNRLIALTCENADAIADAICEDYAGARSRHTTLATEVVAKIHGMEYARDHLEEWTKPESRESNELAHKAGATSFVLYQPKGVVGLISPWNMPYGLTVSPLTSVLAAGNRAMIKLSEFTPVLGGLMQSLVRDYFAEDEISVILGGPDVGRAFAHLPFDHLIFTGSTKVGRQVMEAAARNLVPVTLELGGKSPVIVGATADLDSVAQRLAYGKFLNGGQLCLAPDYVLMRRGDEQALIDKIATRVETMFPKLRDNADVTGVISQQHFDRLMGYVDEARSKGAKVTVIGDHQRADGAATSHRMPLYVVQNVTSDMQLMQEEIFGPVLPIVTYESIAEGVSYVRRGPKPLAIYYFGNDADEEQMVCDHTESGGFTVNDLYQHYLQEDLPFGGVGASGMGAYHGRDGFIETSHARAVFRQAPGVKPSPTLSAPFAPEIMELFQREITARKTAGSH